MPRQLTRTDYMLNKHPQKNPSLGRWNGSPLVLGKNGAPDGLNLKKFSAVTH